MVGLDMNELSGLLQDLITAIHRWRQNPRCSHCGKVTYLIWILAAANNRCFHCYKCGRQVQLPIVGLRWL